MNSFFLILTVILPLSQSESPEIPSLMANNYLYLCVGEGELDYGNPNNSCEYYFHIPITYGTQVPLSLTVDAPDLIDYRFMKMENNNVLCVARMGPGDGVIRWESLVMIERNIWSDIPEFSPIPDPTSLPDSVTSWLESTDCCQLSSPYVSQAVEEVGGGIDDIIELADSVENYVESIPWEYTHTPKSFDAEYAIKWGSSCTGHAHVASALFRGNGVPSRNLLNLTTFLNPDYWYDQHWVVDYYIPDYGWVMAESGMPTVPPQKYIVTFVIQTNQEFTKWMDNSIDALWHSSSPFIASPTWARGHRGYELGGYTFSDSLIDEATTLGAQLWDLHTSCTGQILNSSEAALRVQALSSMNQASEAMISGDITSYITYAQSAVSTYQLIYLEEIQDVFSENFEEGIEGWTHGGDQDVWELGAPVYGATTAYSGTSCWATDLSGNYENNSDCWLLSPVINLNNLSSAELTFWLWNDTEDFGPIIRDYLFVEVSIVGEEEFTPLSGKIGGLNNDPEIEANGGWTRINLDLYKYITNDVQLRFTLHSNSQNVLPGSYIDDVIVSGRYKDLTGISSENYVPTSSVICSPNPCSFSTTINIELPGETNSSVSVFDLTGRRVSTPATGPLAKGCNSIDWDCCDENGNPLPAGIYIIEVEIESDHITNKVIVTH